MIDFSLLARVNDAIKKHAHVHIEIFRQHNKSANYFGGWKYVGGDAPISYDLFVDYERIEIRVGIDDLEELMPPEETALGCIRESFRHGKYASKILIWLARLYEARHNVDVASANVCTEILGMLYDVGEVDDTGQARHDIVNYKYDKAIGKRILGIKDDDEDDDDDNEDDDDEDDDDEDDE